jgi:hypothetical protein
MHLGVGVFASQLSQRSNMPEQEVSGAGAPGCTLKRFHEVDPAVAEWVRLGTPTLYVGEQAEEP